MTEDEILVVATLWQEARGSSAIERLAVAHVIRNRMARPYASDGTIAGTVLRPWQFSGWMNPAIKAESLEYAKTDSLGLLAVWNESANDPDPSDGAVLYYSPGAMKPRGSAPYWAAVSTLVMTMPEFLFFAP